MEGELATIVTQFGVAGLIGWMWLTERRACSERERQLAEAHERLMQDGMAIDVLVRAVDENTRATAALEEGQRRLVELLDHHKAALDGVARAVFGSSVDDAGDSRETGSPAADV